MSVPKMPARGVAMRGALFYPRNGNSKCGAMALGGSALASTSLHGVIVMLGLAPFALKLSALCELKYRQLRRATNHSCRWSRNVTRIDGLANRHYRALLAGVYALPSSRAK